MRGQVPFGCRHRVRERPRGGHLEGEERVPDAHAGPRSCPERHGGEVHRHHQGKGDGVFGPFRIAIGILVLGCKTSGIHLPTTADEEIGAEECPDVRRHGDDQELGEGREVCFIHSEGQRGCLLELGSDGDERSGSGDLQPEGLADGSRSERTGPVASEREATIVESGEEPLQREGEGLEVDRRRDSLADAR